MSGHSKWATIKHKKGAADAKRGRIFSRLAKEIMVAARDGGGDPAANITLRTLIQKGKAANMPNDNIDRAIKKGTGEIDGGQLDEMVYEGFAAGGVGLVVKVLTDNKNRAAAEVRHIFKKSGSDFAASGSVSRSFERKGEITVPSEGIDEETLMNTVLEAGAEDMEREDDQFLITTDPSSFSDVCNALTEAGIETSSSEVTLLPMQPVPVNEVDTARAVLRFVSALEDNDDVQDVYTSMEMSDEVIAAVSDED